MATVALMLSAMLAGCLDSSGETLSVEVTYESTSATIVERWVDGELVEAMYPVLMFDFNRSVTTGEFIQFSVIGEHAVGSTPASESTVVQVEFRKHGLQELTFAADVSGANPSELDEALPTATVRIKSELNGASPRPTTPCRCPLTLETKPVLSPPALWSSNPPCSIRTSSQTSGEAGTWRCSGSSSTARRSPVNRNRVPSARGESATWKTLDFDTSDAHELRVNYEEGQDAIEVEQVASIQYEHLETSPAL